MHGDTNEGVSKPDTLNIPIRSIYLSTSIDGDNQQVLYSCSSGDCMSDVMDDEELVALTQSVSVDANDYSYITINLCEEDELSFNAEFSGMVALNGVNYYTEATDGLKRKDANETHETLTVNFDRCNFYYQFQTDYTVEDTDDLYLTFFMDNTNLMFGNNGVKPMDNGCFEGDGGDYAVCVGFPHIAPIVGTTTPTVEQYLIYNSSEASNTAEASIFLVLDSSDSIVGGWARRYILKLQQISSEYFDMPI